MLRKKIAIISDTHGNEPNFQRALNIIKEEGIRDIIHCGDVGGLDFLKATNFKGKIYLALGNMDTDEFKDSDRIKVFTEFGEIDKIAFCHLPDKALELACSGRYDFVFYGHTHKPWQEKIGQCQLINPGNLAGLFFKASFAILNEGKLILKIL